MKISTILIPLCAILLTVVACKNPEQLQDPNPLPESKTTQKASLTEDMRNFGGSAPIGIQNVEIIGNEMHINVKYSGGCKPHEFQLIGHKMISKSLPPQRTVKLFHNANEDDCRQIIQEKLVFDISSFAYGNDEIKLILDGYSEQLSYKPQP